MPVRKPVITALDTYRVRKPSFSRPQATWNTPIRMVSVTTAGSFCSVGMPARASNVASDIALVVLTSMNTEPVVIAATGVPIMPAYSPWTGLSVAITADAMLSGMAPIAVVIPAIRSAGRFLRSGTLARRARCPHAANRS